MSSRPSSSVGEPREAVAQLALEDLAAGPERQLVDELHQARALVAPDALAQTGQQLLRVELAPGGGTVGHDDGEDLLAVRVVRDADDGGLVDGRVADQD